MNGERLFARWILLCCWCYTIPLCRAFHFTSKLMAPRHQNNRRGNPLLQAKSQTNHQATFARVGRNNDRATATRLWAGGSSSSSSSSAAVASAVLQIEHVTYTHDGINTVLDDLSYVLPRGAQVALVGRNGIGKSTLLHLLAGRRQQSSGQVVVPRGTQIALVEQEPPYYGNLTVEDVLLGLDASSTSTTDKASNSNSPTNSKVLAAVRSYRAALKGAQNNPQQLAKASTIMEETEGSWQFFSKVEEVAQKLRVWHLRDSTVDSLSGGELKRLALASALAQEPDILLLDEPTNYLSLSGVQWLAEYLKQDRKLSFLMVTHDRAFLDEVCDRILELDRGKLYETVGSYSDYLQAKEDRLALQDATVQSAKSKYRVELEWMRRQPQARQTKSKSRIDAFYKLTQATKPRPRDPHLVIDGQSRRLGGKILSMRGCNLRFGPDRLILNDFSYDFCKGDRICLAGANGVGKTTFVKVLTGAQPLDSGTVEVGDTIVMGVFEQLGIQLEDPNQSVLDFVLDRVREGSTSDTVLSANEARNLLKRFEFPQKRWAERVSVLSGGERRRLQMLSVFSRKPNFLVMDEPSVDCDLDTLQALEKYLQEFDGVLIIVSHDRAFADKVTDHLFIFDGNGEIKDFTGSLSEYASTLIEIENDNLSSQISSDLDEDKKAAYRDDKAKRNEVRNLLRRAKKDMEKLEKDLDRLKEKAEKLQTEIDASANQGWSVIAELTDQLNAVNTEIEDKEVRWMELAEELEETQVEA